MALVPRFLADAASNLLFHWAEITDVIEHGPDFRSIRLRGTELEGLSWNPGDKVQIRMDGLTLRTYTPTAWDAKAGTTSLLAFQHGGSGPGDAWVGRAQVGRRCQIFGPRRSLRLDEFDHPPVMVGDETSIALSLAWRALRADQAPRAEVYEVTSGAATTQALADRGIYGAILIERRPDGAHLPDLQSAVASVCQGAPALCLTGKVQTIASVRDHLRSVGALPTQTKAKAYWDERRSGLD